MFLQGCTADSRAFAAQALRQLHNQVLERHRNRRRAESGARLSGRGFDVKRKALGAIKCAAGSLKMGAKGGEPTFAAVGTNDRHA